jgi:eukaryotic-like serine/threonine-protein kinase
LLGSIIDKYEVMQKIGEGGMATVYRGRHTTLGRDVAIKVLHPHLSSTDRNRKRFAREAQAIERLDHENILKILDYSGETGDKCYIIMELIEGPTLKQLIEERQRLPSEVVAIIGIELAKALDYAHQIGLVHRDLKPENVMLRRDGTVKLTDFGIARFIDDAQLTMTGTLVGSPAYMSPEQAMEKPIEPNSDLFSLGTLLYHLVCGQLPFTGSNPSIILRNIIECNYVPPNEVAADISTPLSSLITKLLQTKPDDRPLNGDAVIKDFHAVFSEASIEPNDMDWQLRVWLSDPDGYESRLNSKLLDSLLVQGRLRLEEQDHLGAQPLFNRLLSIDPENLEALEILQSIHHIPQDTAKRQFLPLYWSFPLITAGILAFAFWPSPQEEVQDVLESEQPDQNKKAVQPFEEPPTSPVELAEKPAEPRQPKVATAAKPILGAKVNLRPNRQKKNIVPKEAENTPPAMGKVRVTVPASWADIWIDGKKYGRTGQIEAIDVEPGSHELRLENDFAMPYQQTFTVSPGESKLIEVTALRRKPTLLDIPSSFDDSCVVTMDGTLLGNLLEIGHQIVIKDPALPHRFSLECQAEDPMQFDIAPQLPGASVPLITP